ncbi:MAG: hypothetical protein AAGA56_02505 [Myxococcota bacterium]
MKEGRAEFGSSAAGARGLQGRERDVVLYQKRRSAIVLNPSNRSKRDLGRRFSGRPHAPSVTSFGQRPAPLRTALEFGAAAVQPDETFISVAQEDDAAARRALLSDEHLVVTPPSAGTAIQVLVPLIRSLLVDPDAVIVLLSADEVLLYERPYRRALQRALAVVEDGAEEVVILGADSDAEMRDHRDWLLPAGQRGRSDLVSVAQWVRPMSARDCEALVGVGAMVATGTTVCRGIALVELYEDFLPRMLELGLLAAEVAPCDVPRLLAHLPEDQLRFPFQELLTLSRRVSAVAIPHGTGWSKLDSDLEVAMWMARRRCVERSSVGAGGYVRVAAAPGERGPGPVRCSRPRRGGLPRRASA